MKYVVALFWSLVIGQVVGYIMTALSGVPDNTIVTAEVSLFFGLVVILFIYLIGLGKEESNKKEA